MRAACCQSDGKKALPPTNSYNKRRCYSAEGSGPELEECDRCLRVCRSMISSTSKTIAAMGIKSVPGCTISPPVAVGIQTAAAGGR